MKQIPAPSTSQRRISSPAYDWVRSERIAILREPVEYETPIKGYVAAVSGGLLAADGLLFVRPDYMWDFGSGPAINTPGMVYGSLAHDILYDMMKAAVLPWSLRKEIDQYFRDLLKDFGVGFWRRNWVYWGVRIGYPVWRALGL